MATLTEYKGLEVVNPDPTGAGGLAIQDNFKRLADWQVVGVIRIENTPPASPALGDRYLVGSAPTGDWLTPTDRSNQVALWDGSAWEYSTPQSVFNADEQRLYLSNDQTSPIQADALGNARGANAVDLQSGRSADTQVASADFSAIGGGRYNTASGTYATVSGGYGNTASNGIYANTVGGGYSNTSSGYYPSTVAGGGYNIASGSLSFIGGGGVNTASAYYSTISGGYSNTASAYYSTIGGGSDHLASGNHSWIGGGRENTASGSYSSVAGGQDNTASGDYSSVPGGISAVADKSGQLACSAGRFTANGDAQVSTLVSRNSTTNATATNLFLNGSSNRLTIPTDTAWVFMIHIVAAEQGMANITKFQRAGVIVNDAGTTAISSIDTIGTDSTIGSPGAWTVSITADNTNDALDIAVTGAASTNIRWVARVTLTEVSFPA